MVPASILGVLPVFIDHAPDLTPPAKPVSYQEGHNPGVDLHRFSSDLDIPAVLMPPKGSATTGTARQSGPHPANGSIQLATAPDIDEHLSFAIVGGADEGDFKITESGLLKFKKVPISTTRRTPTTTISTK